jgi:hypothetical protein
MAAFAINKEYSSGNRTVEAEDYVVKEPFVHFVNLRNKPVLTLRADNVYSIERVAD